MQPLRPGIEYFARIAACAALLTTSLFGQWLHHQAYHNEIEQSANSSCSSHSHCHSCGHSPSSRPQSNDGKPSGEQNSPAAPHDHNSCGICYVIDQCVSDPVTVVAPTAIEPLFEPRGTESEDTAPASCCLPIARGPPAV